MKRTDSVHASIAVECMKSLRNFYISTMASLDYRKLEESETTIRFGVTNNETLIDECLLEIHTKKIHKPSDSKHVRFLVFEEEKLRKFLKNGLNLGGVDATGQGVHSIRDNFKVATLDDAEGNRLEVIFQSEL